MKAKGWAVVAGWASEHPPKGGFAEPLLRNEDPDGTGDDWLPEEADAFHVGLLRLQLAQSLAGIGAQGWANRIMQQLDAQGFVLPARDGRQAARWKVSGDDGTARDVLGTLIQPPDRTPADEGRIVGFDIAELAPLMAPAPLPNVNELAGLADRILIARRPDAELVMESEGEPG